MSSQVPELQVTLTNRHEQSFLRRSNCRSISVLPLYWILCAHDYVEAFQFNPRNVTTNLLLDFDITSQFSR